MGKKKTHNEYVEEVAIKNPNVEVVGAYVSSQVSILHKCKLDGYEWMARPNNILHGKGCPKCAGNIQKTHKEYVDELNTINQNIEVLEKYEGAHIKILHKCKIDGNTWKATPHSILCGGGCPECKKRILSDFRSITHHQYVERLNMVNPYIEVIEEYKGACVNILHKCKIDNYKWSAKPGNVLHGCGCPKCAKNVKRTHEEYVELVSKFNKDIEVVGTYINGNTSILHRCKIDNRVWTARPADILQGKGCPRCNSSHGEKQVLQWLERHDIYNIPQKTFDDCRNKNVLPFDFYLPDFNICIEYDGEQHFEPVDFAGNGEEWALQQFNLVKHNDAIKTRYCQDNNIKLLRIPYFKDVETELSNFIHLI